MTEFTSEIISIPHNQERVFTVLSDLNNLGKFEKNLSALPIKDLTFDKDSCTFKADGVGKIAVRIVEREPFKTIKLVSESSPVGFTGWIQLVEAGPSETRLKLSLHADIPLFLKPIISKPLEKGINKAAETLATLPY
jgi:hypothetical protein